MEGGGGGVHRGHSRLSCGDRTGGRFLMVVLPCSEEGWDGTRLSSFSLQPSWTRHQLTTEIQSRITVSS